MNIHPMFVHFPIALLTIYAIAELLRFKKLVAMPYYFYVKAVLVITGSLSSLLAIQTGEMIAGESENKLVEAHSQFANISAYIFGFIAIIYILHWIKLSQENKKMELSELKPIQIKIFIIVERIYRSALIPLLALVGLATITITGALGGSMVYGPDVDPIVHFVYNLVM